MNFTLADIKWAAENAKRQMVGPMRVHSMALAMDWVLENGRWFAPPTLDDILHIAALVEPDTNLNGFRNYPISIAGQLGSDWHEVPRLVQQLIEAHDLPADEWYKEFETIHPFGDGNGRTGAILWNTHNWRDSQGEDGVFVWTHPPDFFDQRWFE